MCWLRIRGKFFNYSIINVHAPTEDKSDIEKDVFYDELRKLYDACPKHDVKPECPDWQGDNILPYNREGSAPPDKQ